MPVLFLLLKEELKNQAFWQTESFWAALAALGGLLSAVAAFLTIRQAARARRYELQTKRPFLRVIPEKVVNCPDDEWVKFPLKIVNIGGHPAEDVAGRVLFINRDYEPPVMLDRTLNLANDFAQQAEYTFNIPFRLARAAVVPQQFILLALRYRDAILGGRFEQFFYFTWYGCPDGQVKDEVSSMGESRDAAERFFDNEIREFRFSTQQAVAAPPFTLREGRLQQCHGCQAIVAGGVARCGACGAETRGARMKSAALVPVIIFVLLILILILSALLLR